jgi:hypothetical protein
MSKERELLKKALDFMLDAGANLNPLFKEINDNLLAQPEQEPVAWMQDDIELYVQESKDTIRGYVIPLYTSPPKPLTPREALTEYKKGYARAELDLKREPLSEDVIWDNMPENPMECSALAFVRGVKFAEKAHGIGGE